MKPLRSLAVRTSAAVVRWASPGCKEWAEAQARELAVIPGDWSALAWSLGSTRILLDRQPAPAGSRSELPARPRYLEVIFWLLYLEACVWSCAKMLTATVWSQRSGWALILLAWGYWAACSVFGWLRDRWQPPTSDIQAYRLFLREGLELKLVRYRTIRRWFPLLANLFGCVGYLLIVRGEVHSWGYFILLVWLSLHRPETPTEIQKQIERMDARIAEGPRANFKLNAKRARSDHWGRS